MNTEKQNSQNSSPNQPSLKLRQEQFQQYLIESKLMDCLTKILMEWYETNDKPSNIEEYLKDYFSKIDGYDINQINDENQKLQERILLLKDKLAEVQKELEEDTNQ